MKESGSGRCERKKQQKGRESNEKEFVYTDIQRPSRLNETASVSEGLKAFIQTKDRDISKEDWTQYIYRERETDR